jgi:hypothetical protein
MAKKSKSDKSKWDLEAPFDQPASLEELLDATPFTDAGGSDSTTAGTRIPKWLFRRVMKLAEASGTPYELASDVYRDAIFIGLRVIYMRYKTTHDWSVETKMAAVVSETDVMRRIRSQVDGLASGLDNLMKEGEPEKAAEKLNDYVSAAIELEDEWSRSRLFKMLRENKVINNVAAYCSEDIRMIIRETDIKKKDKDATK